MRPSAPLSKLIFAFAAVNSVAALAIALAQQPFPDAGFWMNHAYWLGAATVATIAIPLVQSFVVELGERRRREEVEREQKIQTYLIGSLVYVVRNGRADWENTGIQAFVVRGRWWWKSQVGIAKIRIGAVPSSGIRWTKGKGVIGRCWRDQGDQYENLTDRFSPYLTATEDEWEGLSPEATFGLNYAEFQKVKGKHGIVAAVPIVNKKGEYIGCVTCDMPPLGPGDEVPVRKEILKSLAIAASYVAQVL